MNIDDVGKVEMPQGSVMSAIFSHQKSLMEKYDIIERRNGAIVPDPPYFIDDAKVQSRFKDLAWRTTEEIAEAFEELKYLNLKGWKSRWEEDHHVRHFFEELADALHFLVEASIVANLTPTDVELSGWGHRSQEMHRSGTRDIQVIELLGGRVVWALGLSANCLKNKPWKSTQMPTDSVKFKNSLMLTWKAFKELWDVTGASVDDIYLLYAKKNVVNQFRQASNY